MIKIDNFDIFVLSYNRDKYIVNMIKSLLNQTIGEFKITILDNGSSDNTKSNIEALNNKNIIFIGSKKNNGALWNFQRAQNLATKKYTILFHDDDLLHPKYLEYAIKVINENQNISLVCSGMVSTTNPKESNFKNYSYNPKIFTDLSSFVSLIYLGFPLNFATAIYKTEYFKTVKIDFDTYGKIADRPLMYDSVFDGKIAFFTGQYIQYRIHSNQDSTNSKTGPFYYQTIALHKKYKDIIWSNNNLLNKMFFLINFYRYLNEEYGRFYNIKLSKNEYVELAIKELNIKKYELIISKIFYLIKLNYLYKFYRFIKRKLGEYS
jgi:glycosyltransferase involved in cell wall biosynthesis